MIDLQLSHEHDALVSTVSEWGRKDVLPQIHDLDREHRFNRDFLRQMGELQLLGICIPEEWGGAGMDYVSLGLACEELEYIDTHLRVIMSVHVGLNSMTLWCWGTEDQKKKYLVPQARGEKIATYGLTEPNAGSDAVGIQTTAVRKADRYVLNGEKMWISLADVAGPLPGDRLDRPGEEEEAGPLGHVGLHRRASLQGLLVLLDQGEVGHPRRQYRRLLDAGRRGAGRETGWARRVRDSRSRCSRSRTAATRGLRRHGPRPRVPRRLGGLRPDAQDVRGADRRAQLVKEMIAQMVSTTSVAAAVAARRVAEERGATQHPRDLAREVVRHGGQRTRGRRRGADPWRERLFRRVPVGRFYRNCKAAVIYEGSREVHKLMQADYALGYRQDKPRRIELPAYGGSR